MGLPSLVSTPEQKIWIFGRLVLGLLEYWVSVPTPSFPTLGEPWYPISYLPSAIVGCDTCDRHTYYGFDGKKTTFFII
jgi:hypothetical protein